MKLGICQLTTNLNKNENEKIRIEKIISHNICIISHNADIIILP